MKVEEKKAPNLTQAMTVIGFYGMAWVGQGQAIQVYDSHGLRWLRRVFLPCESKATHYSTFRNLCFC